MLYPLLGRHVLNSKQGAFALVSQAELREEKKPEACV